MTTPSVSPEERHAELQRQWTDRLVRVSEQRPELKRFHGIIGRVVTVNWNNRAVVDFQDGGWYDVLPECLTVVDAAEAKGKYNAGVNSAQPRPDRQS